MTQSKSFSRSIFPLSKVVLAVAGTVAAINLSETPARASGALWISAPTWSYSSALAQSPVGTAYYWGLSVGVGSYSFAYAFSNDGLGDAAYAYAQAAAGRGGRGAFQFGGLADPWAGDAVDISLIDPSNPSLYPTTNPASNPFSTPYTVSPTGITFTESSSTLSGDDEIEAFVYNGSTSMSGLEADLGASSSSGTTSAGDVTGLSTLETDFGLIPLDAPADDPSSLSSLAFTENTGDLSAGEGNVILVGIEQLPEPSATWLVGIGIAGLLIFRKFRAATVA
jgi:hypothetical protein